MYNSLLQFEIVNHEIKGTQPTNTTQYQTKDSSTPNKKKETGNKKNQQTERTTVIVVENSVKFEVDFQVGHKTGFFCDQVF